MTRSFPTRWSLLLGVLLSMAASGAAQPPAPAVSAFNAYVRTVEARVAEQNRAAVAFPAPVDVSRLRGGDLVIEKLTPEAEANLPGAMLHDWRGTAFVPGATAADFDRLMRSFDVYPTIYAPQVLGAHLLAHDGNLYSVKMRVRQKHVLTVVLDTTYNVTFGQSDAHHAWSTSRSTRIDEIADAGTPKERALPQHQEHGFLWRLNTYWTCEERDGGVYLRVESISLTRSIPPALAWAVRPFVESVPRESLEFTLRHTRDALIQQPAKKGAKA